MRRWRCRVAGTAAPLAVRPFGTAGTALAPGVRAELAVALQSLGLAAAGGNAAPRRGGCDKDSPSVAAATVEAFSLVAVQRAYTARARVTHPDAPTGDAGRMRQLNAFALRLGTRSTTWSPRPSTSESISW